MSDDICVNIFSGINGLFASLGNSVFQNNASGSQNSLQNLFIALFLMAAIVLAVMQQNQRQKVNESRKANPDVDRSDHS